MDLDKPFDTNPFFSGGAGMFIQYHDVIKPVYLFVIIKMIITKETYGIPVNIVENFSVASLMEWYIKRRYVNPLKQLDFMHKIDERELDIFLMEILKNDPSIYDFTPTINFTKMMNVYKYQHMAFPIYVYTKQEEPYVREDCKKALLGNSFKYVYGDIKDVVLKDVQNFTYIFSDIELMKIAIENLKGTCSHILLTQDYRYNYIGDYKKLKYDLLKLMTKNQFVRTGTTQAINRLELCGNCISSITKTGGDN